MSYITPAQFLRLYDGRNLRDNLSDTGSPVVGSLDNNDNLLDALAMASEVVAAAALVGERYSTTDLDNLAASTTVGFLLRRITADIAFAMIVARRGRSAADVDRLAPARAWAEQQLDLLRTGTHLFPGTEDTTAPAGLPSQGDLDANLNRYNKLTAQARRVFPFSCNRQPRQNGNCC